MLNRPRLLITIARIQRAFLLLASDASLQLQLNEACDVDAI